MNTLNRIKAIIRSRKSDTPLLPVGGELMVELQKHLATLDLRIEAVLLAKIIAQSDKRGWDVISQQIQMKKSQAENDEKKVQTLTRLGEIATQNTEEALITMKSYDGKTEELTEIRKRVLQAIGMIEIENNVRSVIAMSGGKKSLEHQVTNLELETREIRRLLYTTDGLMEITS